MCIRDSYYTGSHRGTNLRDRINDHNSGNHPNSYTYNRRPVQLVWNAEFNDPAEMVAFERQIKGWSRAKKEALIREEYERLKELSKSNSAPADFRKGKFYKATGIKPRSS